MAEYNFQPDNQLEPVSGSSFHLDVPGNSTKKVQADKAYMIDWTKLTSVNDLVLILQMLGIAFPGNHPGISEIERFLDFGNPIPLNQAPSPSTTLK